MSIKYGDIIYKRSIRSELTYCMS